MSENAPDRTDVPEPAGGARRAAGQGTRGLPAGDGGPGQPRRARTRSCRPEVRRGTRPTGRRAAPSGRASFGRRFADGLVKAACMAAFARSGSTAPPRSGSRTFIECTSILSLAGHQGVERLRGDLDRVVLGPAARAGVRHVGALEERRVGRPGQKRGDGDAGVLELVPQGLAEGQDERLRRRVGGVVRAGHEARGRRGEQHPAGCRVRPSRARAPSRAGRERRRRARSPRGRPRAASRRRGRPVRRPR